jgi:tRNA (cmo5U34)-methyltransferase
VSEDIDDNAAIWKSDDGVAAWLSGSEDRERQRGEQRRLMADLLPFGDEDSFVFVDLGAGTGAAARAVLDRYPKSSALLAEYSPQMVEAGTQALAPYRGRFQYVAFDLTEGPWPVEVPDQVGAIISSMFFHHLPDPRKESLCAEVFARLEPGGWFLDFDVATAEDPVAAEAWRRAEDRRDPAAALQQQHRTADEQHRYDTHIRHISPLSRRLAALRAAGFEGVDTFWKRLESVLIGGRRPH